MPSNWKIIQEELGEDLELVIRKMYYEIVLSDFMKRRDEFMDRNKKLYDRYFVSENYVFIIHGPYFFMTNPEATNYKHRCNQRQYQNLDILSSSYYYDD